MYLDRNLEFMWEIIHPTLDEICNLTTKGQMPDPAHWSFNCLSGKVYGGQIDVLHHMCVDASGCSCFRERANLQLVNRRLERKVKEMMMQGEEEHNTLQDQRDQVRVTTLQQS